MGRQSTSQRAAARAAANAATASAQSDNPAPGAAASVAGDASAAGHAAAPHARTRVQSGTVTVACKLPHGLILQLTEMHDAPVPVLGGGVRMEKQAMRVGPQIRINGNAVAVKSAPRSRIVNGYALTTGVPADFWNRWLEQNKTLDVVVNKLIFAHATVESARAESLEHRKLRNGMEPIDPDPRARDPRMPKAIKTKPADDADLHEEEEAFEDA